MKQDTHKNNFFEKAFSDREISPSANAWDKLSGLLDEQMPVQELEVPKQNNYRTFIAIAAVIVCVCGFVFWSLNNNVVEDNTNSNLVVNQIPTKILSNDNNLIIEEQINKLESVILKETPKINQQNTNVLVSSLPIIDNEIESSDSDTIAKTSIAKTQNKIHIAWETSKTNELQINSKSLLRNVERELIQEHVENQLNKPKDKFEQIRFAISNRNIQE